MGLKCLTLNKSWAIQLGVIKPFAVKRTEYENELFDLASESGNANKLQWNIISDDYGRRVQPRLGWMSWIRRNVCKVWHK